MFSAVREGLLCPAVSPARICRKHLQDAMFNRISNSRREEVRSLTRYFGPWTALGTARNGGVISEYRQHSDQSGEVST